MGSNTMKTGQYRKNKSEIEPVQQEVNNSIQYVLTLDEVRRLQQEKKPVLYLIHDGPYI